MNALSMLLLFTLLGAEPPSAEALPQQPLGPGDHSRTITVQQSPENPLPQKRHYLVHIPPSYDPSKPTPVVLALHGAAMNGPMMAGFSGLSKKADQAGFIVVYPSGTGVSPFLVWNAGGFTGKLAAAKPNDVTFISHLLDEIAALVNIDSKRVYACGMSNGGMMSYRLAAELSDRIAAIAPIAGTIAIEESKPMRPVSVLHFHGLQDTVVPFTQTKENAAPFLRFKGVEDSVQTWIKLNGCNAEPTFETLSKEDDSLKVIRKTYSGGKENSEVILVTIDQAGHTWPGQQPPVNFLGKSTTLSANDLMWEFFQRHSLP